MEFCIVDEKIEIVDKFTYLSVNSLFNGNITKAVNFLTVLAYINLLCIFDILIRGIKMILSFFDKLVVPILTYGF